MSSQCACSSASGSYSPEAKERQASVAHSSQVWSRRGTLGFILARVPAAKTHASVRQRSFFSAGSGKSLAPVSTSATYFAAAASTG